MTERQYADACRTLAFRIVRLPVVRDSRPPGSERIVERIIRLPVKKRDDQAGSQGVVQPPAVREHERGVKSTQEEMQLVLNRWKWTDKETDGGERRRSPVLGELELQSPKGSRRL